MKKLLNAVFVVGAIFATYYFLTTDLAPDRRGVAGAAGMPDVQEAGYFKSDARDRVQAFWSQNRLSRDQALALFEAQTVTAGAIYRGVVYSGADNPAPQDALTRARGLGAAVRLTVTPPHDDWDWMYIVNPAGEASMQAGDR